MGAAADLIESSSSSQDDVRVLHLNGSLAQSHQICSDSNGSACYLRTSKHIQKHSNIYTTAQKFG